MYAVQKEKSVYSKADIVKLRKIGRGLREAKKDPEFRAALREFIKETTSK